MKEILYLIREFLLVRKILLLSKLSLVEKLFPRSPAFSSIKYAPIREDVPMLNLDELKHQIARGKFIYVFGLPKSGNVWAMNLLTDVLGLEKGMVTFTHGGFMGQHYYNKNLIRGVCIMRDIRDVVVSLYHFSSTKGARDETCRFNNIESFYYEYFINYTKHYSWEEHASRLSAWGLPIIKYERLWDNPVEELIQLFAKWRIVVPREDIEKAVEKNSIDKYKNMETNVTQKHICSSHFRKGGYGGYHEEIPSNVLSDINRRYGSYMQRWGYELDI